MNNSPWIICLCGSTKFYREFQEYNFKFTMEGYIVLSVGFYPHHENEFVNKIHGETVEVTEEQKIELDELHKRKIDLADEVFIINKGGYIGESTRSEINYTLNSKKILTYMEKL